SERCRRRLKASGLKEGPGISTETFDLLPARA
ncbi:hypothetical protein AK812_SmicGene47276, partial [Symbiodinium microadriaticum]